MLQKTIICNWKMTMPYHASQAFAQNHFQELDTLSKNKTQLIICPSFESLSTLISAAQNTSILIGAQNCSAHETGAYTSQVSSVSLSVLGVTHCIIGHSETRRYLCETDQDVKEKLEQLFAYSITPIICIGESTEEYKSKNTLSVLAKQLEKVLTVTKKYSGHPFYIAYEPIWAIGSGTTLTIEQLTEIFLWLHSQYSAAQLLYGGGVNESNCATLNTISFLDGFLIGGASTDFQKLKKIVSSLIEE